MFCSNCGSKVPDGSKFCSVCGTRLAEVEPAGKEVYSYSGRGMTEPETNETFAKSPSRVSFDWSNVIEEPVKKVTPNVRSPWEEMQVEDRPRVNKPSVDHRRTMSFIEILKQEREEKLQAAEAEAKSVTEREEATPDFSIFDDAPQIYTPQVFEDIKPVEQPVEEFKTGTPYEEVNFEQPAFEEPKYEEPFSFENDFEEPLEVQSPSSTPAEFEAVSKKDDSDIYVDTNMFESVEPSNTAKSVEDFYSAPEEVANDADPRSLEAELDEILNANYGDRIPRSQRYEEFKTEPVVEAAPYVAPVVEAAPAVEPVIEEAPYFEPVVEAAPYAAPVVEAAPAVEPVIEETPYFEPAVEPVVEEETVSLEELIAEPSTRPSDPAKSTIAPPAEDESEIADLKKRLSDLMASPEPEDLTKPAVELEDYDTSMFEPNVAIQKPEVANFAAPSEEPASNELTLEDLEQELFGDELPGDIDAEATKKIDKFYTLYKKNEEFQRLLDEEYNKLKEEETQTEPEEVEMPVVEKFEPTPETENVAVEIEPVPVEKAVAIVEEASTVEEVPADVEPIVVEEAPAAKDDKAAAKQAKKEAKAAAKQAKKEAKASDSADKEEGSGGGALTVLAVIIAFLLVILLGVILILNFAPDSGLAMSIDSVIGNIASYFSATDAIKDVLL